MNVGRGSFRRKLPYEQNIAIVFGRVAYVSGGNMIFVGLAVIMGIAAFWSYSLSGTIEEKRQKLKNHRGITRAQSSGRKTMTVVAKNGAYVLGCLAILCLWLHFGLGL